MTATMSSATGHEGETGSTDRAEGRAGKPRGQPPGPIAVHAPNLAEVYRTKVAGLQEALTASPDNAGVLERLRDLVDRVDIGPGCGSRSAGNHFNGRFGRDAQTDNAGNQSVGCVRS